MVIGAESQFPLILTNPGAVSLNSQRTANSRTKLDSYINQTAEY